MEFLATSILFAGMIDDLRSKKVHNKLIIALTIITLISVVYLNGIFGLTAGLLGFALALVFGIPLVLTGVLGGGDMKLLAVFGLATNSMAVLWVVIYSIIWGALLGVVRAIFMGRFSELVLSTTNMLWTRGGTAQNDFKFPYTVALFFGWLTHLSLMRLGVSLW